jgi:hypothetical protein
MKFIPRCNFFAPRNVLRSNNTMKNRFFLFAFIAAQTLTAQTTREPRDCGKFDKIRVSGMANVTYWTSDTDKVVVVGLADEVGNINTKNENGTLVINTKTVSPSSVKVEVHSKQLTDVAADGASSFKAPEGLHGDVLHLSAAGAGRIKAEVHVRQLMTNGSGAGEIVVSGKASSLQSEGIGASSLKAYELETDTAEVTTSGAASAKVNVKNRLRARASGASSIRVQGDVQDMSAEATSAASISRSRKSGSGGTDSVIVKWKDKEIGDGRRRNNDRPSRRNFYNWAGFSVGVNGLITDKGGLTQQAPYRFMDLDYSSSYNLQLNPLQYNFHIFRNHLNLVTGLGIEWRRYSFDNPVMLNADTIFTHGIIDSSGQYNYRTNVLKSAMLQVPLLLEFNSGRKPGRSFHLAAGVIGQFLLSSKSKRVLERKGEEITIIRKDNFNLNPFQVKAHVSVGYSYFTVFGEYNLTPLFHYGRGPVNYPFTIGLRIVPFIDFD